MSQNLNEDDALVIQKVLQGDVEAYGEIMKRYETKLERYVVFLIHDPTMSRDVVQETFIKAYRNLQSFDDTYKFSSWVYRIAHNEAMNAIKRRRHSTDYDVMKLPDKQYERGLGELLDATMRSAHVHHCVRQLRPKYRDVVQLAYFEHLSYKDIGDILHIPTSTVGVWLSRAKKQLQALCAHRGVTQ